jgi:hypothetical protein
VKAVVRARRCELGITLGASAGGRHRVIVIFLHPMLSLSSRYCWTCLRASSCCFCGWSQFTYLYARSYIFWPELRQARPGKLPQSILIVLDSLFQKSSLPSLAGGAIMRLHCLIFLDTCLQCLMPWGPVAYCAKCVYFGTEKFRVISQALASSFSLFRKLNGFTLDTFYRYSLTFTYFWHCEQQECCLTSL